jgi:hypothetical protein
LAVAERTLKAPERTLLALDALIAQAKGTVAELRKAHDAAAPPTKRRRRAKVSP